MQSKTLTKPNISASTVNLSPRARIVGEARRHFLTHGFRRVTMDDLAMELGMSKKTIYAHFANKSLLLEAVLEEKLRSIDEDLSVAVKGASLDFSAALLQLLDCVSRHAGELQPPFVRDLSREAPHVFKSVQTRRRAFIRRHFGTLLGEGRKEGMIRKDIAIDLMLEILLGATDALMNPQKLSEMGIPAKTCLSAIITLFLEGVVTSKARSRQ